MRKFLVVLVILGMIGAAAAYAADKETHPAAKTTTEKAKEPAAPTATTVPDVATKVFSAFGDIKKVNVDKKGVLSLVVTDRSGNDVDLSLAELEPEATIVVTYIRKNDANMVKTLSIVKSAAAPKSRDAMKKK